MKFLPLTKSTVAAFLLATGSLAHADPALDRLKAEYVRDLQSLYERYSQAGRLDDAIKVLAELRAVGAEAGTPPGSQEPSVVGTAWKTPTGTIFVFEANHRGHRSFNNKDKTTFTWKGRPGRLVECTGPAGQGQAETTWFFRIESDTEAYYGSRKNDVVHKLQRQK
jgi:hypothetical protein